MGQGHGKITLIVTLKMGQVCLMISFLVDGELSILNVIFTFFFLILLLIQREMQK